MSGFQAGSQRWERPKSEFSLGAVGSLNFESPDHDVFPSILMAYDVCRVGGTMPVVFNAANEEAVRKFLEGKIAFLDIFEVVTKALEGHDAEPIADLSQILEVDHRTRELIEREH